MPRLTTWEKKQTPQRSCPLLVFKFILRVSLGDDVDLSLHVEALIYRQTLPIYCWLPILRTSNTRYIVNGSRLETDRWTNLSEAGIQFVLKEKNNMQSSKRRLSCI